MTTLLKKGFRILLKIVKGFAIFVILYFICYWIGSNILVNKNKVEGQMIEIFIRSNGVHTDLIFPVKTSHINWDTLFPATTFKAVDTNFRYVAMGWGDKGFYLETPTWADLKASTAFKAVFFLSSSAMHVSYHQNVKTDANTKSIKITTEQYKRLIQFYSKNFERHKNQLQLIANKGYTNCDNFYEAKGTYSFLKTCNIFTNNALKEAGIKAPIWSPFAGGLIKHY